MSARRRGDDLTPGQDSFLDIVSNLVGILIILVMVIGVQAKHAIVDARSSRKPEKPEPSIAEVERNRKAVGSIKADIDRLKQQTVGRQIEVAYRRKERDHVLEAITAAEQRLAELEQTLDEDQRQRLKLDTDVASMRQRYEDLQRQIELLENTPPPTTVIKHVPTPMAQTVFGHEAHFRLKADRIAHVPLDGLVDRFKDEAQRNAWKLKEAPTYTDVVGPFDGFRLKYTLRRATRAVQTPRGTAVQERVELDHFELIPVEDTMGEPLSKALTANSDFLLALDSYPANKTVVTVWVYPDSFGSFRELKEAVTKRGYLIAGRPLPFDQYISASPNGTRSAAQ